MKLSIIIPTYNRANSLRKTLQSILDAEISHSMIVEVAVIDNNSNDETKITVEEFVTLFGSIKLNYVFEKRQGKVFAFNTGVLQANGDLFSCIDDDIRIEKDWFIELEKVFQEKWNEIEFVGGKILPIWEVGPPSWVELLKEGVIGWRDYGNKEWFYKWETPMLAGGHAVFKRSVFDEIGPLPEQIGPIGKNLIGCEDDMIFDELMSRDKKGLYWPKLVVYHYVPAYRLSKNYYRQWNFGAGMSWDLMEKHYKPYTGRKILGVPGYLYKDAIASVLSKIKASLTGNEQHSLQADKNVLLFLGYLYGRKIAGSRLDNPLKRLVWSRIEIAER